jgi:hypothetical protein
MKKWQFCFVRQKMPLEKGSVKTVISDGRTEGLVVKHREHREHIIPVKFLYRVR